VSRPLRVPFEELSAGVRPLPGALARYVTRVRRLSVGARLALFDPGTGMEAAAELVLGSGSDVWCRIETPHPSGYRPLPIHLLQGLAKADKPDEAIRAATALGASRVTLVRTERSVARLSSERGEARLERWKRIAVEAARQSGRGDVPSVAGPLALEEALAAEHAPFRLTLAPHAAPLFERLAGWEASVAIALLVGPEGGFDERELDAAGVAGFLPASLGDTTLRTELAGVAALGALVALSAARAQRSVDFGEHGPELNQ
jgi:16S rRNA (uracil1498-N3)-methyltransferase